MKKIRLCHRILLNSVNENIAITQFLKEANNYFQGSLIKRIWSSDSSNTITEIKRQHSQYIKQYNIELTELAKFYLSKEKPYLPYLLDRHQVEYETLEAEVYSIKFNEPDSLAVAIHFFTKEYALITSFGHYLVLSKVKEDGSAESETFMVELNPDFSIHNYSV